MKLRLTLFFLSLLTLIFAFTGGYLYHGSLKKSILNAAERRISLNALSIEDLISSFLSGNIKIVKALAGLNELRQALKNPDEHNLERANLVLDHFRDSLEVGVCYLMDAQGNTIASSNRQEPESFIGKNYAFRPYFRQAIQGIPGLFMGLGVTSKERGVYYSHPVYGEGRDALMGCAVIKTPVDVLEKHCPIEDGGIWFLTDPHGIVFVSNHQNWLYHFLWKPTSEDMAAISEKHPFAEGCRSWTGLEITDKNLAVDPSGNQYLIRNRNVDHCPGWNIFYLGNVNHVLENLTTPFIEKSGYIISVLCLLILISVLFLFIEARLDIVQQKKMEDDLRKGQERLYSLVQNMPVMMDAFDADCNIVAWNKECERVTGYRADEIIGNPRALELLYPDDTYRREMIAEWLERGSNFHHWELELTCKDGSRKIINWSNVSETFPIHGWHSYAVGVDVTERVRAQKSLVRSRQRLSEIINALPDAIFAVDTDGLIVAWNPAMEEMSGVKAQDMLGKGNYEYALPFHGERIPGLIDLALRPDLEIDKEEFRFFTEEKSGLTAETAEPIAINNQKLFLWVKASQICDQKGKVVGAIESIRDVSARRLADDALRESEAQKQAILDASIDRIRYADKEMKILWANKTTARGLDMNPEDLIGRTCYEFFVGRDTPCEGCPTLKAVETGKMERAILWYDRLRGVEGQSCLDCYSVPLKNESGEVENFIQITRDITEQTVAARALQASEEKFRTIFAESPIGIELYDSEDRLINANKADLELFGISCLEQMKGCTIFNHPNIPDHLKERLHIGQSIRFEEVHDFDQLRPLNLYQTSKSGKMDLDVLITPIGGGKEGVFRGYLAHYQEISDRKRAEKHIHALTQKLIKAQETERQEISRYLHDSVAQDLSMVRIGFETLFDNEQAVSSQVRQRVVEFSRVLRQIIRVVRDLSYDLHPDMLNQQGLVQAVVQYCDDFSKKTGLEVDFFAAGLKDVKLDFDTEINMYRIIQEALNNIFNHADAAHVRIRLVASFPNIILRIQDDGIGFDLKSRMADALNEKRMGLRSMKERTSLLNGDLRIQSTRGKGTKIFVEVPYKEKGNGPQAASN
jgi:PAS domain S-box-containing protein